MQSRAALYLRSSKDRKDVSIQDQRELLTKLAAERGLIITQEFVDVVESGKDEDRPGFQSLLSAIGNPQRGWDHILCRDTSRLARGTWLCGIIDYEAHKRGVTIVYANVPETDPMSAVLLVQIYRAQDQIHSMMSKEKGLAGMRQNVTRGFRAGGRAPWGYKLKPVPQGIVRDGREITKTLLELGEDAGLAQCYLQLRAKGVPRAECIDRLSIDKPESTLIGVEWNALTYTGATVWNVHREFGAGGYAGQGKRRPRSEWVITRDTHPALITEVEAEAILGPLERGDHGRRISEAKRSLSSHLLTGLLQTPAGQLWEVNGRYYRARGRKNKHVDAAAVEQAVTDSIFAHLNSDALVLPLIEQTRNRSAIILDERQQLQARIASTRKATDKAMKAALLLDDPGPALRQVDELERERKRLVADLATLDEEMETRRLMAEIKPEDVRASLREFAALATTSDLKHLLRSLVERITLDPDSLTCQLHYRLGRQSWESVASPRRSDRFPTLRAILPVRLAA